MRFLLPVAALLLLTVSPAAAQLTLVPYGSSGYRYLVTSEAFPPGAELPGYDDSAYSIGGAPFSSGGGCSSPIYTPVTGWPVNSKLVARLHFTLAGTVSGATIHFGIDNDVIVYLNGVSIANVIGEGCANYNQQEINVPAGLLQPGANVLVALATDRGGVSAFDMSLTADMITPTNRVTWGKVKSIYR